MDLTPLDVDLQLQLINVLYYFQLLKREELGVVRFTGLVGWFVDKVT
jgi:hypothetical protein